MGINIREAPELISFYTLVTEAKVTLGRPKLDLRSPFHLKDKLHELAEEAGWEVVVEWEQNSPVHQFEVEEGIIGMVTWLAKGDEELKDYVLDQIAKTFEKKQVL